MLVDRCSLLVALYWDAWRRHSSWHSRLHTSVCFVVLSLFEVWPVIHNLLEDGGKSKTVPSSAMTSGVHSLMTEGWGSST